MSRLVSSLEQERLVVHESGRKDKRVSVVRATAEGQKLLQEGRNRRTQALAQDLECLSAEDLDILRSATQILQRVLDNPIPVE